MELGKFRRCKRGVEDLTVRGKTGDANLPLDRLHQPLSFVRLKAKDHGTAKCWGQS